MIVPTCLIQSKSNKNCDKGRQECLNCSCLPVSTQPIRSHELTELLLKCKMVFIFYVHISTSMKMRDLPFLHEIRFFARSYCCLCIGWYSRICLYWVIYKQAVNVQFSDMNSKIDSVKRGRGVGVIAMKRSFRGGPVRNNTL